MIYSFHNTSFRDQQTGLYNHAYFMEVFYREWHRVIREKKALCILSIKPELDIHTPFGVETFVQLATLLEKSTFRATDLVSRFDQAQFIIGLFDLAPEGAVVVIERIIDNLKSAQISDTFVGALHVMPDHNVNINEVFDQALSIERQVGDCAQYHLSQYAIA